MSNLLLQAGSRLARWRLARTPGVTLAKDARIAAQRVALKPGCTLRVGERSVVEAAVDFERDGAVVIVGANTFVGASTIRCAARVEIGSDVEIAWDCSIVDHDWESLVWERRRVDMRSWYTARKDWTYVPVAPVRIGDRALVGFGAVILKGVEIGEGAVVGVGSVVTKNVAPYTVVGGAPARVLRRLDTGVAVPAHAHA
jgi:acetyltransferase-like isoleucine patch superfamily enzyme